MADRPRRPRDDDRREGGGDRRRRQDRPQGGGQRRDDRPQGGGQRRDDRPRQDRPWHDRPRQDRPWRQSRPRYEDRPGGSDERPRYEDRPRRDERPRYEDRPRRDERPRYEDRPRRDGPRREDRPWTDGPRQREDRPPREEAPRFEDRRGRGRFDRPRDWAPGRDRRPGGRPDYHRPESRRPPRPALADSAGLITENEELICGRRPVEEAFAAHREAVRLLIVPERRAALDALAIHATTLRIPVIEVEGGTLTALAGFDGHQGVGLVARPRAPADVDTVLAHARQRGEPPFLLVLDSLEDPQNFGSLLRSAEATGVHGVIYPTRRAAPLSPAAIKASAGATEHLLLAPVDDLAGTLADLHVHGLRLVGADEDAPLAYAEADLRGPLALVVGSEGRGISSAVRRRLDLVVRIPMRGKMASLNAAVAGSILLFATAEQRPARESDEAESVSEGARAAEPPVAAETEEPPAEAETPPSDTEELLPTDS